MNDYTFSDAAVLGEKVKEKVGQIRNSSTKFLSTRVVAAVLQSSSQDLLPCKISSSQESQRVVDSSRVIVLCTGTKSHTFKPTSADIIDHEHASENISEAASDGEKESDEGGKYLRDCHAEVLARRALKSYLLKQIEKCSHGEKSVFKKDGKKFSLMPGIGFHLYISEAPCGDAKVHSNKRGGMLMNKIADGQPCHTTQDVSERSRIMTCSDKLLLWNVMGVQGAALSNLLTARIFFTSLIIGQKQVDLDDLYRAVYSRLVHNDFKVIYPSLAQHEPFVNKLLLGSHALQPKKQQNNSNHLKNKKKLGLDELKKMQVLDKKKIDATKAAPIPLELPEKLDFETLQRIQKLPKNKNPKVAHGNEEVAICDLKILETESSASMKNTKCFNWISGMEEELEILYKGLKESDNDNKEASRLSKMAFKRDLVRLLNSKNTNKKMNCTYREIKNKAKEYQKDKQKLMEMFVKYQMGFWQKADSSVDMF